MDNYMKTFLRKYKPKVLSDFYFDNDLQQTIELLMQVDNLNVLFIGSPSTGKTSLLNVIMRNYYNLTEEQTIPSSNILYINNIKEQGIRYFRSEMKIFCQSKSTIRNKKKMIIIDDLDNISDQCQQVFRNYIDKYSNNINFVSSCCNGQKIIESLQSRLHLIKINYLQKPQINEIVNKIIVNENINIDADSIEYLMKITNNSIHQIINYLEKIYLLNDSINMDMCKKICSNIYLDEFETYIEIAKKQDLQGSLQCIHNIYDDGYSVIDIFDFFFHFVKITNKIDEEHKYQIIKCICNYITIVNIIHENKIELTLFTKDIIDIFE